MFEGHWPLIDTYSKPLLEMQEEAATRISVLKFLPPSSKVQMPLPAIPSCPCVVLRGFYSLQATGTALIGQNITKILQNISHPISCLQIYNSWLYGDRSIHPLRTWSIKPKINFLLKFSSLNLNWIFLHKKRCPRWQL